jgi:predicted acylesterase/phospholipase RssA
VTTPTSPHRPSAAGRRSGPRVGLALAGGGPLGAIYELGALCALEESLPGLRFAECDAYIGVSAGGFIAAGLANGLSPRDLCRSFIENEGPAHDIFEPSLLLVPAWREVAQRLLSLPGLWTDALFDIAAGRSRTGALERLASALPTGLFSNDEIHQRLQGMFSAPGRSNDFRELHRRLVLVATDLDTGEAVSFGLPGHDHVPISRAVQASAALPGLFPPVEIDGRHYVDGALKKTVHASVLLDEGLDLLLCLNPLVPFNARGHEGMPRLAARGLPTVLSQTFRSLIHSRLELGLSRYKLTHPDTDIVLFEPDPHDHELFDANIFSYSRRRQLAEHAYQRTRSALRGRRASLAATFARHGITLDEAVIDDPDRRLLDPRPPALSQGTRAVRELEQLLDRLERRLGEASPAAARR